MKRRRFMAAVGGLALLGGRASGPPGFEKWLRRNPYATALWWGQEYLGCWNIEKMSTVPEAFRRCLMIRPLPLDDTGNLSVDRFAACLTLRFGPRIDDHAISPSLMNEYNSWWVDSKPPPHIGVREDFTKYRSRPDGAVAWRVFMDPPR